MFNIEITTKKEYESLIQLDTHSKLDVIKISRYPYKSLTSLFDNITNYEKIKIKEIEDLNIYHFLNVINLLFGVKDTKTLNLFYTSLSKEPLRTAVFLAKQESESEERLSTFIYYACKILLSNGGKINNLIKDPIDVKISGKMPFSLFCNKQNLANDWYKSFVEHKLLLAKKAFRVFNKEEVYSILLQSVAYSLFNFTPHRYHFISSLQNENEVICLILRVFLNQIKNK